MSNINSQYPNYSVIECAPVPTYHQNSVIPESESLIQLKQKIADCRARRSAARARRSAALARNLAVLDDLAVRVSRL